MVKVTVEADGKAETFEGDCFCGFLMNYKDDKVDAANIVCGKINYPNVVQSLLILWKIILEARTKGDKDLKEMLRAALIMKLSTLDLDGGGADDQKD